MNSKKLQGLLNPNPLIPKEHHSSPFSQNRSQDLIPRNFVPPGDFRANSLTNSPSHSLNTMAQNVFYYPNVRNPEPVLPSPFYQPVPKNAMRTTESDYQMLDEAELRNAIARNTSLYSLQSHPQFNKSLTSNLEHDYSATNLKTLGELLHKNSAMQTMTLNTQLNTQIPSMSMVPSMSMAPSPVLVGINQMGAPYQQIFNNTLSPKYNPTNNPFGLNVNGMNPQLNNNQPINSILSKLAQIAMPNSQQNARNALTDLINENLMNNNNNNNQQHLLFSLSQQKRPELDEVFEVESLGMMNLQLANQQNRNGERSLSPTTRQNLFVQGLPNPKRFVQIEETRRKLFNIEQSPQSQQVSLATLLKGGERDAKIEEEFSAPAPKKTADKDVFSKFWSEQTEHINALNTAKLDVKTETQETDDANWYNDEEEFDLKNLLSESFSLRDKNPGVYNKTERINKILKYKGKIRKWRRAHPVSKRFTGRSSVAGQKNRIRGKFVKPDVYEKYLAHINKKNSIDDK